MSEAVAVPNLMMITLIVSEESLLRDRHTDTETWLGVLYYTYTVIVYFANKNRKKITLPEVKTQARNMEISHQLCTR